VATTANGVLIPSPPVTPPRLPFNRLPILCMQLILWMLLWLAFRGRAGRRLASDISVVRMAFAASILLLTVCIFAVSGCGGGSTPPPPPNSGTPIGTYTLTVTLTATESSGNVTHTQPLTLTVQ
jgi:hypothetical protein